MNSEHLNTIDSSAEDITTWAYVEIMGHSQVAGRLTTRKLGACVMLQVDVPKGDTEFCHSELYSPSSIFSIKPTTEKWCREFSKSRRTFNVLPFTPASRPQLSSPNEFDDQGDNDDQL